MYNVANRAFDRLAEPLGTTDTVLEVYSADLFPAPPFLLSIEDEIVAVIAVSGTNFTVIRGVEDTVSASYPQGTMVRNRLTAGTVRAIQSAIVEVGGVAEGNYQELKFSELSSVATNIDGEGVYQTIEWRRKGDTLYAKSQVLGNYPYPEVKIDYYNEAGTAVVKTITWELSYDDNEFPYMREVV